MVILMKEGCKKSEVGRVLAALQERGLEPRIISPGPRVIIGVVEEIDPVQLQDLTKLVAGLEDVEGVETFGTSWKLVSRAFRPERTVIRVGGMEIGGGRVAVMAGPCAVESREKLIEVARAVQSAGAHLLRGGAFKPRSSPYSFRGMGEEGLKILVEASQLTGLPVITEVLSPDEVPLIARYADVLQIGTRNMQNFALLEAVGDQDKPVLLKRGLMSTVKELLLSAEYILARGNTQVMLCERGIRTFETETRNTLDLSAVPVLKKLSHLPVIVDPSHAAGKREYVPALALAAVAAGADGLMIEVHQKPEEALSDGRQSLTPADFSRMMAFIEPVAAVARGYYGGEEFPAAASGGTINGNGGPACA
jgi:3-deoxy-7-phosphoheptulonate synthase